MTRYHEVFADWKSNPEEFWAKAAQGITWYKLWDRVFDPYTGEYGRWFAGAECNTAYNCLDRHVEAGRGDQPALIYDSPVTGTKATYTYSELTDEVATLAGILKDLGVEKGDRVIIYMPMIPQAVMAMLACARIGAVHSVVFGGFAAAELATRIDDAKPKTILAASCGIEPGRIVAYKPLLDEAIDLAGHKPDNTASCCSAPRRGGRWCRGATIDWAELRTQAKAQGRQAGCVPPSPRPTRSTSSTPRARPASPRASCATTAATWSRWNGPCPTSTTPQPGEVFWAASDVGWVVGHSYIVYAPLLHGCTTLVYEGKPVGTPGRRRLLAGHGRTQGQATLFTAPTAFRRSRRKIPEGKLHR